MQDNNLTDWQEVRWIPCKIPAYTKAEAALAAGIFHRDEVPIEAVKKHMKERGIETR